MGSQSIQSKLWGQRPKEWATLLEPTGKEGYEHVLRFLRPQASNKILDIGCGSGYFANLAAQTGAQVTGLDATAQLIEEGKLRNPSVKFLIGDMEELPFVDASFDIVCGFNSFQFAANTKNALSEAKRVLIPGGKLVVMIWGDKKDCEAVSYLKALGSLQPPAAPGTPGPFALSENNLLENILTEMDFDIVNQADVDSIWSYPDVETAVRGLLSTGPAAKAIEAAGHKKVHETIVEAMRPYITDQGQVVCKNKFRVVISEK
ncbi:MAG: class I SAM-dependent methyltransferase [Bacteroidetes bacterium]|nr:class I SAM-dependent methyltransferase [Bacteroidota bacterium]MBS1540885.1 class I SAM-dependent methyltransferase [Bacteroidota bacterium]